MMQATSLVSIILLVCAALFRPSSGHGRLIEPPSRNAMWRFGFPTKPNYDDNGLNCGGFSVHWQINKGKCGVCGDAFNGVREHETGGAYANNITVRQYEPGSTIDLLLEITANHGGHFQFEMCWRNSLNEKEDESCFETLNLANGSVEYPVSLQDVPRSHSIRVKLPSNKECEKCVLRWHWRSGNNWGECEDGTSRVGCGPQETFRNCADVAVFSKHTARQTLDRMLQ